VPSCSVWWYISHATIPARLMCEQIQFPVVPQIYWVFHVYQYTKNLLATLYSAVNCAETTTYTSMKYKQYSKSLEHYNQSIIKDISSSADGMFSVLNCAICYWIITACAAALCSVEDGFLSKGKTLIFDCLPDLNPVWQNLAKLITWMSSRSVPNFIAISWEMAQPHTGEI